MSSQIKTSQPKPIFIPSFSKHPFTLHRATEIDEQHYRALFSPLKWFDVHPREELSEEFSEWFYDEDGVPCRSADEVEAVIKCLKRRSKDPASQDREREPAPQEQERAGAQDQRAPQEQEAAAIAEFRDDFQTLWIDEKQWRLSGNERKACRCFSEDKKAHKHGLTNPQIKTRTDIKNIKTAFRKNPELVSLLFIEADDRVNQREKLYKPRHQWQIKK